MEAGLSQGLQEIGREFVDHAPNEICISGAGPIRDNTCTLSNVPWTIDGDAISAQFRIPTRVINDFSAISYGIPLLDVGDREQITPLRSEQLPPRTGDLSGTVIAVVGAGTGLGFGYLIEHGGRYIAFPSEGGHATFAPYDELSTELYEYITDRDRSVPGAELFVSGQGITGMYRFFRDTGRIDSTSPLSRMNDGSDPAAVISQAADEGDPIAEEIMKFFVRNYARVASNAALHFLPNQGLYLAGGIVTKNERWFLEDNRFISWFEKNYREHIAGLLENIPVYIVKDYAISLYGAAHAAFALGMEDTS